MLLKMSLYERIVELCQENGTSATALCRKITGSSGNLSTWKNNNLRPEWLAAISDEFGVSVDYILGKTPVKERFSDLPEDEQEFISVMKEADPEYRRSLLDVLRKSKK